jgi:DNA-binding response OmpR family regulator
MTTYPSIEDYTQRTPRLLIVDDNEVNRVLLERMLGAEGYSTDSARDGREALDKLAEDSFDLLLLDIMMPVLDGISTLRFIRADENTATLPAILISAMTDTDDIVRGLEMGANDYITKPVDMGIALARVKTQVTLKYLADERDRTIERLRQTNEMREQFFRMASHDLKNPLTNLRVAQVLLKELIDPNDVRSHTVLDTMTLTISTMQQVIEDFLDSAAAQSGALDIRLQAVNADALLQQVIEQQLPIAYDKQIDLQMANAGLWIHADPARLLQVLQNLLGNAIKYSPVGSEVRLWAIRSVVCDRSRAGHP